MTDNTITPTERRRQLALALRDPMVNFEWKFPIVLRATNDNEYQPLHTCGTEGCAMGYAAVLFPEVFGLTKDSSIHEANDALNRLSDEELGALFDMTRYQVDDVFWGNGYDGSSEDITPVMVADALDALGYPNEHIDDIDDNDDDIG